MLYTDTPARIQSPGTWPLANGTSYTVGSEFVHAAMRTVFDRTRSISADIETYGLGLNSRRIKSVTFGDETSAVVMDSRDPYQENLIRKTFAYAHEILFYKSTFDVPSTYLNGLLRLADVAKVTDPLLYARLATPGVRAPKTLEVLADRYLSTGPGGELRRSFKAMNLSKEEGFYQYDLDRPIYLQGAAADTLMLHRIRPLVRQHAFDVLVDAGGPFGSRTVAGDEAWALVEREQRINRVFLARSCRGFRVDFEYLDRYREANALELAEAEEALAAQGIRQSATGKFNAQDLATVLEKRGEISPDHPRTLKTGKLQMTAKTMETMSSPLVKQFKRHGQIQHIAKDYIGKTIELSINGRVHPEVNLLAAVTGRASYGAPPTHQFSGPARGIVMADEGDALTSLDLSQGEPVTIASMARDIPTLEAYESGISDVYTSLGVVSGMLPHGTTTADCDPDQGGSPKLKKIRSVLKVVVLAQLYGEGLPKLSADLGLDPGPYRAPDPTTSSGMWEIETLGRTVDQVYPRFAAAEKLRDQVMGAWPRTAEFVRTLKKIARRHQKIITVSGRIIPIPYGPHGIEAHKGVNYPCQGGQYDAIADILIKCIDAGLGDAIYLTQHDEFLVSTSAAHDIRRLMEEPLDRLTLWAGGRPARFRTDRADYGPCWGGTAA